MTRKETALENLFNAALKNGCSENSARLLSNNMRCSTIKDIEKETVYMLHLAEQKENAKAKEEYFLTPEGAARKAEVISGLEDIVNQMSQLDEEYTNKFNEAFKKIIPNVYEIGYSVVYVSSNRIEFGIGDNRRLRIDISYNDRFWGDLEDGGSLIQANVSATGSFAISDDSDDSWKYYVSVGMILQNGHKIEEAYNRLIKEYRVEASTLRKIHDKATRFLDNPLGASNI